MLLRRFLLLFLVGLLSACAADSWQMVAADQAHFSSKRFSVKLPVGWMSYGKDSAGLLLSRDSVGLQYVTLNNAPHDKAFTPIDMQSSGTMLPSELAELAIALLKAQQGMTSVEVLTNRPVVISGKNAFRLHVGFENQKGLNYEGVLYGFADDERFYLLSFYATQIHYFQRDLPVFEAFVESFQLI